MPNLNELGNIAHGKGGVGAFLNNVQFDGGGGADWLDARNDQLIAYQHGGADGWYMALYNPATGTITRAIPDPNHPWFNLGANALFSGGGTWAAWLNIAGVGLYSNTGLHLPLAGLLAVGADGEIGYTEFQQEGLGCRVHERNGDDWELAPKFTNGQPRVVFDLQLLGARRAIWTERNVVHVFNLPTPQVLPGGVWAPKAFLYNGEWWISYFSGSKGVVTHPFNSFLGYQVVPVGQDAWFDALPLGTSPSTLRFAISRTEGEAAGHVRAQDYNILVDPRVDLAAGSVSPIVPIGRDCWLGFYVGDPAGPGGWFTNAPKTSCPGNAYLDVITSTYRRKSDGAVIASFIHGAPINGDVEAGMQSLEQQAAASDSSRPVILYWDARHWPRKPAAPSHAWLCAQANRLKDEPIHLFEADVKSELVRLGEWYPDAFLALSGQCYTSNAAQTSDLASIPPVVAALTKADVWVTAILVFSGTGRATGLQDHPDVRPNWEELFAGITGEPGGPPMSDGIDPVTGNLVDPEAWFNSKRVGWSPAQYREWLQQLKPDLRRFGIGLQTDGNGGHLPSDLRGRAFLTWEACPNAAPQNAAEDHLQVHQTGPCCGIGDVPCLFVDLVNREATQWTFTVGGGKTMDDYVPLPQTPIPPDPPDGDVGLTIHSFPTHYRRGEIGGLTIVYEAARPNGDYVNLVEMWLDDGAPHQFWANLPPNVNPDDFNSGSWRPGDKDGFYFRTAGFKADRNGEWRLFMRCRTVSKKWSPVVQGAHTVIVTE